MPCSALAPAADRNERSLRKIAELDEIVRTKTASLINCESRTEALAARSTVGGRE